MNDQSKESTVLVIPSLEPSRKLLAYVRQLQARGFYHIVLVDDGSGDEYRAIFEQLEEMGCAVLRHPQNRGKGRALKTGFGYIQERYDSLQCVATLDSDGQHAVEDVERVIDFSTRHKDALTLGARAFENSGIPVKSFLGNKVSSGIFAALYGKWLPDTQTGLRAFGKELLPLMREVEGERFEYEIQMLVSCVEARVPIQLQPIEAIYENNNEGTHFKPLRDSAAVMGVLMAPLIRFLFSSLLSAAVDIGIAWFLLDFFQSFGWTSYARILAATSAARMVSIALNYLLNRYFVFAGKHTAPESFKRYGALCVLLILLSSAGVYGLREMFGIDEKIGKLICDALLFVGSYHIQQRWVFSKGEGRNDTK